MARTTDLTALWQVAEVMEVTDAFKGKRFSITGHLSRSRDVIVKLIEQAGGHFDKSPDYRTTFLVSNLDWSEGSTVVTGASRKLLKARQNGTKILSEEKFLNMLINSGNTCAIDP